MQAGGTGAKGRVQRNIKADHRLSEPRALALPAITNARAMTEASEESPNLPDSWFKTTDYNHQEK